MNLNNDISTPAKQTGKYERGLNERRARSREEFEQSLAALVLHLLHVTRIATAAALVFVRGHLHGGAVSFCGVVLHFTRVTAAAATFLVR